MKRERYSIIYSSKTGNTKKLAEDGAETEAPEPSGDWKAEEADARYRRGHR